MNRSHFILGAVFAGLILLGAVQGNRLDTMEEDELFYRWVVSSAIKYRVEGSLVFEEEGGPAGFKDDEVFQEMITVAEERLRDVPVDEEDDLDARGEVLPKLVRAARLELDKSIWNVTRSPRGEEVQDSFLRYWRQGKIFGVPEELQAGQIYADNTDRSNGEDADERVSLSGVYGTGITSLFLGFRKVAATFVWLQVDKYWHQGQMHRMVPLMRTCVTLDPSFVEAYLLGAWHLAYNIPARLPVTPEPEKVFVPKYGKRLGLREEWYYAGTELLKKGIDSNPRDYRLYFDLGYAIYEVKLKDHPNAIRYLREATRYRHDKWVPRMLYLAYLRDGQYEKAIEGWKRYLEQFPGHPTAERFLIVNQAYLAEAMAADARECARAAKAFIEETQAKLDEAEDSNKTQELQAELDEAKEVHDSMLATAEVHHAEALATWEPLLQREDPLAIAHVKIAQALEFRQNERYLEAISLLQEARWETDHVFERASDLIIEIKQEAGLPLTVSERKALQREKDAAQYRTEESEKREIRRIECPYIEEESAQPA